MFDSSFLAVWGGPVVGTEETGHDLLGRGGGSRAVSQ